MPQGLIESIGHSVQQKDAFGIKFHPQSSVYLPPPTGEIPPPPNGLESLPLASAAPFHSNQGKANFYIAPQLPIYQNQIQNQIQTSQCSHGPNLAIPQLQQAYGVPNQPLDVSHSSSFEIAQNALQSNLLTSYGPPASGSVQSIDSFINTHEVHEPSSSYGPPPSGNPFPSGDSFAHSSQKSLSTIQIEDNSNSSSSSSSSPSTPSPSDENVGASDANIQDLPGLENANLDIISAQKSQSIEIPIEGEHGTYSLQFQAADPLASQNNEFNAPNHQKLLSDDGLLQSILAAIEHPKKNDGYDESLSVAASESIQNHPDVKEFVNSPAGQETLAEVKAE